MKIKIICVGKIKENFYRDAISEYVKRLSRYATVEICEVTDEKTPDKISDTEKTLILSKEGERIKSKIKDTDYLITLEIEGDKVTSEGLARKMDSLFTSGVSSLAFVIGGSLGIDDSVKKMSSFSLSFSDMTFPHQLMRVILLEQIYRAFKINAREPYHK